MAQIYGYIRTSRQLQEGAPGMDPASQDLQLRRAGVPRDHIHPSSRDPTKSTIDNAIALRKGLDRHHNATAV